MSAPSAPAELFDLASAAWGRGQEDEAARLLGRLLQQQPDHAAALNALALIALGRGDPAGAIVSLERAALAEPGSQAIWFNLYQAHDKAGALDAALEALDRALAIDPYFVPALVMKAALLERLARVAEATALYRAILAASPPLDTLPPAARDALAAGLVLVEADDQRRTGAIEAPLREVEAAYPGADFDRVRAYAGQRTGRRKVFVQQPVDGHFPYLPALEFFARDQFPWLGELEAATGEISRELRRLWDDEADGFAPYVGFGPTDPVNQWAELNHSPRWSACFFWKDGEPQKENIARCPFTAALLDRLPLLDLPGKGPTAMFSILAPHTRIPPHTGSNNVRATIHLPLVVPDGCGFRVGAESREWRVGTAWAFDDTIEHEAWNGSDKPRALLIVDAWNPLLSEAERAAVRVIG